MGARLSAAQRDVYHSFVGVLLVVKVKFSKGQLKQFVRKLFLHFPNTTPEAVTETQYWGPVMSKFADLAASGDQKAANYLFWSQQIRTTVEKIKGVQKGSSRRESFCSPCSPSLPAHSPLSWRGILKGAAGEPRPASPGPLQKTQFPLPWSDYKVCSGEPMQPWPGCRGAFPSPSLPQFQTPSSF